jgi:hypothetical protein
MKLIPLRITAVVTTLVVAGCGQLYVGPQTQPAAQ